MSMTARRAGSATVPLTLLTVVILALVLVGMCVGGDDAGNRAGEASEPRISRERWDAAAAAIRTAGGDVDAYETDRPWRMIITLPTGTGATTTPQQADYIARLAFSRLGPGSIVRVRDDLGKTLATAGPR